MKRLSRNHYYMKLALLVSERATCRRARVGCVLVDSKTHRVRSVGYNGAPSGVSHCLDEGCILDKNGHCIRSVHAEINALSQLRGEWDELIAYVTHQPCVHCYQALVSFKVKKIFFLYPYPDKDRDRLISVFKVDIIQIDLGIENEH